MMYLLKHMFPRLDLYYTDPATSRNSSRLGYLHDLLLQCRSGFFPCAEFWGVCHGLVGWADDG